MVRRSDPIKDDGEISGRRSLLDSMQEEISHTSLIVAIRHAAALPTNIGNISDNQSLIFFQDAVAKFIGLSPNRAEWDRCKWLAGSADNPILCNIPWPVFYKLLLVREILENSAVRALGAAMCYDSLFSLFGAVLLRNIEVEEKFLCSCCLGIGELDQTLCGQRICSFCKEKRLMLDMIGCADEECVYGTNGKPAPISVHERIYPDRAVMREISGLYSGYRLQEWQPLRMQCCK